MFLLFIEYKCLMQTFVVKSKTFKACFPSQNITLVCLCFVVDQPSEAIRTCTYKTGSATVYKVIIVRQYEGTLLLDLETVLLTWDLAATAGLIALEILSAEPRLVHHLQTDTDSIRTTLD